MRLRRRTGAPCGGSCAWPDATATSSSCQAGGAGGRPTKTRSCATSSTTSRSSSRRRHPTASRSDLPRIEASRSRMASSCSPTCARPRRRPWTSRWRGSPRSRGGPPANTTMRPAKSTGVRSRTHPFWFEAIRFAYRDVMEYWIGTAALIRLDVCRPNHLRPLFSVLYDELAEVGRRTLKDRYTQGGKSRLDLGISESSIDFLVELVHDLGRRLPGTADT